MFDFGSKATIPVKADALPGRDTPVAVSARHHVHGRPMKGPFADGMVTVMFGMGCFWGAERGFWSLPGVYTTAVGYAAGHTRNPTYEEVCTGCTGHNEVVFVVYDEKKAAFDSLLKRFWDGHDPTQGMRQGNDVGSQYRSGIYVHGDDALSVALRSRERFQSALNSAGRGEITTEILPMGAFYYAEEYHQQYLAKTPSGYCGLGGTGICYDRELS